jgi:hypothetical protein
MAARGLVEDPGVWSILPGVVFAKVLKSTSRKRESLSAA